VAVSLVSLQLSLSAEARAAVRRPTGSPDWKHIYQVIANLNHRLPKVPVVYLVGGSAARECTISDSSWAAEVRHIGGPRLRTVELGSNGQNYYQDIDIVHRLPSVPSIVLIGIGLDAMCRSPCVPPPGASSSRPPAPASALVPARLPAAIKQTTTVCGTSSVTRRRGSSCAGGWPIATRLSS